MDLSKLDIHPDDYALYCQEPKDPGGAEDGAIEEEEEDEVEETPYGLNMHCIQPNLWIGDWTASQQVDVLRELGIKHIIAACMSNLVLRCVTRFNGPCSRRCLLQ